MISIPNNHKLHPSYSHSLLREWQSLDSIFTKSNFVYPIFVLDEDDQKNEIKSMPNQFQWSVNRLHELLDPLVELGLRSVILFGVITGKDRKDENGNIEMFIYFENIDFPTQDTL